MKLSYYYKIGITKFFVVLYEKKKKEHSRARFATRQRTKEVYSIPEQKKKDKSTNKIASHREKRAMQRYGNGSLNRATKGPKELRAAWMPSPPRSAVSSIKKDVEKKIKCFLPNVYTFTRTPTKTTEWKLRYDSMHQI